jgi:hypothetical protein
MKNLRLLTLLLSLFFLQCSSSDDSDPAPDADAFEGSFELQLTGDISGNYTGDAFFLHSIVTNQSDDESGSVLTVTLTNENNEDEVITLSVIDAEDTDGVDTGSYTIELEPEDETQLAYLGAYLGESSFIYIGTSGSITLNRIRNDQVEGSITATLIDMNGASINVTGEFKASGITQRL